MTVDWLWWLQVAFILYFLLLNGMYLLLNLLSMASLMGYIRQRAETGELAPYLGVEPPAAAQASDERSRQHDPAAPALCRADGSCHEADRPRPRA